MSSLPHRLERTVAINAPREAVFRFFTDAPRWAAWWGAGSTIDARRGGPLLILHPGGVEVRGEVIEVAPPERIAFTYGYARAGGAARTAATASTPRVDVMRMATLLSP
jgi:uncharacterized protein YndB with AHSA1/START domain